MANVPRLEKTVIYIRLLDEGVSVTRPIYAEILGDNIFRVLPAENYNSGDETWEFTPGMVVRCEKRKSPEGKEALVAVEAYKQE
jgi:hypothetical protein